VETEIKIESSDFWFKIVEMLQQNWALIEPDQPSGYTVYFIHDGSGVFDTMNFETPMDAMKGLMRNGFRRFSEDIGSQKFIAPPKPPYVETQRPNPIYSSGRFWR